MRLRPETCAGKSNPGFLGRRQQHAESSASTAMLFSPADANEKAGLLVFQNETHFYYLCKSMRDNEPVIELYKSIDNPDSVDKMELVASRGLDPNTGNRKVYLRIDAHGAFYSFRFSSEAGKWNTFKDSLDASFLSTKVAGGFVGCMYALYATSLGKPSDNTSYFNWFKYKGTNEPDNK